MKKFYVISLPDDIHLAFEVHECGKFDGLINLGIFRFRFDGSRLTDCALGVRSSGKHFLEAEAPQRFFDDPDEDVLLQIRVFWSEKTYDIQILRSFRCIAPPEAQVQRFG